MTVTAMAQAGHRPGNVAPARTGKALHLVTPGNCSGRDAGTVATGTSSGGNARPAGHAGNASGWPPAGQHGTSSRGQRIRRAATSTATAVQRLTPGTARRATGQARPGTARRATSGQRVTLATSRATARNFCRGVWCHRKPLSRRFPAKCKASQRSTNKGGRNGGAMGSYY